MLRARGCDLAQPLGGVTGGRRLVLALLDVAQVRDGVAEGGQRREEGEDLGGLVVGGAAQE